jgi:hypothetical protein
MRSESARKNDNLNGKRKRSTEGGRTGSELSEKNEGGKNVLERCKMEKAKNATPRRARSTVGPIRSRLVLAPRQA